MLSRSIHVAFSKIQCQKRRMGNAQILTLSVPLAEGLPCALGGTLNRRNQCGYLQFTINWFTFWSPCLPAYVLVYLPEPGVIGATRLIGGAIAIAQGDVNTSLVPRSLAILLMPSTNIRNPEETNSTHTSAKKKKRKSLKLHLTQSRHVFQYWQYWQYWLCRGR